LSHFNVLNLFYFEANVFFTSTFHKWIRLASHQPFWQHTRKLISNFRSQ